MTMRIAGRHAIDLRDANGVRRSTYKARKYRGHRAAIETNSPECVKRGKQEVKIMNTSKGFKGDAKYQCRKEEL
jgi:hypothetical protein